MQSALVVLTPEAEPLVGPFRTKYDPSAAAGMPAHVTILFPFRLPHELGEVELERLRRVFARFRPFEYSLPEMRCFPPLVLYLAPVSDEPLRELTMAVWREFPETPPCGGKHANVTPHLTVAQLTYASDFARVKGEFQRACAGRLPIPASVTEVALMVDASGRWQPRQTFGLGQQ
jgi:2'-5' RNA ligase